MTSNEYVRHIWDILSRRCPPIHDQDHIFIHINEMNEDSLKSWNWMNTFHLSIQLEIAHLSTWWCSLRTLTGNRQTVLSSPSCIAPHKVFCSLALMQKQKSSSLSMRTGMPCLAFAVKHEYCTCIYAFMCFRNFGRVLSLPGTNVCQHFSYTSLQVSEATNVSSLYMTVQFTLHVLWVDSIKWEVSIFRM